MTQPIEFIKLLKATYYEFLLFESEPDLAIGEPREVPRGRRETSYPHKDYSTRQAVKVPVLVSLNCQLEAAIQLGKQVFSKKSRPTRRADGQN